SQQLVRVHGHTRTHGSYQACNIVLFAHRMPSELSAALLAGFCQLTMLISIAPCRQFTPASGYLSNLNDLASPAAQPGPCLWSQQSLICKRLQAIVRVEVGRGAELALKSASSGVYRPRHYDRSRLVLYLIRLMPA